MESEKLRRKVVKEKVNKIPDYEYLFSEAPLNRGKKDSRFLRKILRMNIWSILLAALVYLLQASPTWAMPIVTSNIINITTETLKNGTGVSAEVWRKIIINAVVLAVLILQNIPSTMLCWKINSKMLRRISAGIKCSVVRKLQSLSITFYYCLKPKLIFLFLFHQKSPIQLNF